MKSTTREKYDAEYWMIVLLFLIAAKSGNWLLTPMRHPDASELTQWGVVAQGAICGVAAVWLFYRRRVRMLCDHAG